MLSVIPKEEGLLPKWLLLVSAISLVNTVKAYRSVQYTRLVYNNADKAVSAKPKSDSDLSSFPQDVTSGSAPFTASDVSPLAGRLFGTWTLASALVRLMGAYNITNQTAYDTTIGIFLIAAVHFNMEWLVFRTARIDGGLAATQCVSIGTVVWMLLQRSAYLS